MTGVETMDNITLTVFGLDLSERVLNYSVSREVSYQKVVTTLDGTEHPYPGTVRPTVSFTLLPGTDEEDVALYEALEELVGEVTWLDNGTARTDTMRLTSSLESVFLLRGVDGKRRYKQGTITLRRL